MKRIPFSQVLKNASVDIKKEYDRLYTLFFLNRFVLNGTKYNLHDYCGLDFDRIHFRGTCISLEDFDKSHNFSFMHYPNEFDIDYLVSFCEYSYNLVTCTRSSIVIMNAMSFYTQQVLQVIESIGYMENPHDGIMDFLPKDQAAISVAEIVDSSLSYRVIEYNHHSMKGDLERKKDVLLVLADKLEPLRNDLKGINKKLESQLFTLLNSINIRHNNSDPDGNYYHQVVAEMTEDEIESWYDDTYQMCLLAFLELEHVERKNRVKQLQDKLNS